MSFFITAGLLTLGSIVLILSFRKNTGLLLILLTVFGLWSVAVFYIIPLFNICQGEDCLGYALFLLAPSSIAAKILFPVFLVSFTGKLISLFYKDKLENPNSNEIPHISRLKSKAALMIGLGLIFSGTGTFLSWENIVFNIIQTHQQKIRANASADIFEKYETFFSQPRQIQSFSICPKGTHAYQDPGSEFPEVNSSFVSVCMNIDKDVSVYFGYLDSSEKAEKQVDLLNSLYRNELVVVKLFTGDDPQIFQANIVKTTSGKFIFIPEYSYLVNGKYYTQQYFSSIDGGEVINEYPILFSQENLNEDGSQKESSLVWGYDRQAASNSVKRELFLSSFVTQNPFGFIYKCSDGESEYFNTLKSIEDKKYNAHNANDGTFITECALSENTNNPCLFSSDSCVLTFPKNYRSLHVNGPVGEIAQKNSKPILQCVVEGRMYYIARSTVAGQDDDIYDNQSNLIATCNVSGVASGQQPEFCVKILEGGCTPI